MTKQLWFWFLLDLIFLMLLVDAVQVIETKLPSEKPQGYVLWAN